MVKRYTISTDSQSEEMIESKNSQDTKYNRVVHGKHFWAIFGSFLASFSVHFQPFWQ